MSSPRTAGRAGSEGFCGGGDRQCNKWCEEGGVATERACQDCADEGGERGCSVCGRAEEPGEPAVLGGAPAVGDGVGPALLPAKVSKLRAHP